MTTYARLIAAEARLKNDTLSSTTDIYTGNITDYIDDGFGSPPDTAFIYWSAKRVYFPIEYDGSVIVCSVPRSPSMEQWEQ